MDDLYYIDGIAYKKFTDTPFSGEIKSKTITGQTVNGKKEGRWVGYTNDGRLKYKGDYKNGKYEGPWLTYWDNGQLNLKGKYKNGERDGRWFVYYIDGTFLKMASGIYKDGVKISD